MRIYAFFWEIWRSFKLVASTFFEFAYAILFVYVLKILLITSLQFECLSRINGMHSLRNHTKRCFMYGKLEPTPSRIVKAKDSCVTI